MKKNQKKSWVWHLVMAHLGLWGWFLLTSVFSELNMVVVVMGGVLVYIISMLRVLRSFVHERPQARPVHWIDLFIGRLVWFPRYLIAVIALTGFMIYIGTQSLYFWAAWRAYTGAISFVVCCVVTMLIGWFFWGYLIKQSLITEANIKAHEAFTGTQRAVGY